MFLLPSPKPLLIFPGTYMRSRSDNPAHMHTPLPFRQDGFFPDPRRFQALLEYPVLKSILWQIRATCESARHHPLKDYQILSFAQWFLNNMPPGQNQEIPPYSAVSGTLFHFHSQRIFRHLWFLLFFCRNFRYDKSYCHHLMSHTAFPSPAPEIPALPGYHSRQAQDRYCSFHISKSAP